VAATAHAAAISRTTAYRYFPNQRALVAAAYPETEAASLLPPDAPSDPEARLELVMTECLQILFENEAQQRAMLRLSLDVVPHDASELPLRQGRVIRWLTDALEPLRPQLGDDGLHRLVLAIRSTTGVEAMVWLVDVAGLTRAEAAEQMRWTARSLYRSAVP
jgi:hypothetical protein